MRSIAIAALAVAATNAKMEELDSLFRQFGNCVGNDFGSVEGCAAIGRQNAQCCDFEVVNEASIKGKFCISNEQRDGLWEGTYRDYDFTLWKWQCKQPENANTGGDDQAENLVQEVTLPPFSNYDDKIMEWILWVIYLSGMAWVFGYIVMIPLGQIIYLWLNLVAWWNLIEVLFMGVGDFGSWFMGPFLRGCVVGPTIFALNVWLTAIPGVNFASAFLLGWWAVADYYGYNYELFAGPTLPAAPDAAA